MVELLVAIRPLLVPVMVAVFTLIILWAYAPRRKARLEDCARIPLREDL
jgi:cbb3-type cytochrome oxidase subunit 3